MNGKKSEIENTGLAATRGLKFYYGPKFRKISKTSLVFEIDRGMGIPLQSAAKAPYLAQFKVMNVGVKMLEELATNPTQQILNETSFWQKTIFKAGDDCRQDMLALQIIEIFRNAFNSVGLDVYLFPYKVVATGMENTRLPTGMDFIPLSIPFPSKK